MIEFVRQFTARCLLFRLWRTSDILLVVAFGFCGLFSSGATAADVDGSKLPSRHLEEIYHDQHFNVLTRLYENLDSTQSQPIEFAEILIPIDRVQFVFGTGVALPEHLNPIVFEGGVKYMRFFAPDLPYVDALDRLKKIGKFVRNWMGVKIQGKATFHLWDPEHPERPNVRIKVERNGNGLRDPDRRYNTFSNSQQAILISNIIRKLEAEKPNALASFYNEVFAAGITEGDFTYNYLLRLIPEEALNRGEAESFVPLHGFLNSPFITHLAEKKGVDIKSWVRQEYIPKLAQVAAYYNFELGVWFEGHSQNMSILIDSPKSEIKKFFIKDAPDVLLSPFHQAISGVLPQYNFSLISRAYEKFIDETSGFTLRIPGIYNAVFLSQSLKDITSDEATQRIYVGEYLKAYTVAAGYDLSQLDIDDQKSIEGLLKGEKQNRRAVLSPKTANAEEFVVDDGMAELAIITQKITELKALTMFKILKVNMESWLAPTASDKARMISIVRNALESKTFNWSTSSAKDRYDRSWTFLSSFGVLPVENGVILYDKKGNFPVGVAYQLPDDARRFVNSLWKIGNPITKLPPSAAICPFLM